MDFSTLAQGFGLGFFLGMGVWFAQFVLNTIVQAIKDTFHL